ncbi:hypothetical protein H632_c4375p1 [Helicosporidium sp. ATCC 50920]|nr:hypothetical protein H632_c4375p1 [Helicosporidium sp. ATCC 50920]|eukprot:KDD71803.1 hypothetical protein H632_c4375p1 [Helicosporidium sp. ATCC 50920]
MQLSKAESAGLWAGALAGHELPPEALSQDQKQLMIQRFQDEHPGFDFSGAEFNGQVPDPATFLRDLRD